MTARRRFNRRERNTLYLVGDGQCSECGRDLESGWHADHVTPHVVGGPTQLTNGQPLCPTCNLRKGSQMTDTVQLRAFQREMTDVILDRVASNEKVTVAWVNAGSGKTLGWMNAANELKRAGVIDATVTLVPRRNLRRQAELDWCGPDGFMQHYGEPRLGLVVARENREPLTEVRHDGYIACYASVASQPRIHREWAYKNRGRFMLVCDEAQFLGLPKSANARDEDDIGGGTIAGDSVQELMEFAAHTVIMTGTPRRSDSRPIVGVHYGEPDDTGWRELEWHVRATYKQGVTNGYLRPVQFNLHGGEGSFSDGTDFKVEELESRLSAVVWDERVWKPRVDEVIERLRTLKRLDPGYQGLITAAGIPHAKEIHRYAKKRCRDLSVRLAVSDDDGAEGTLSTFRNGDGDLLVTVQMAYIGYDCKPISVIGLLNTVRWPGNLEQTIARGTRIWGDRPTREQTCYVIGPADPALRTFAESMRKEAEAGLRERHSESGGDGPAPADEVELSDFSDGAERVIGLSDEQDISDPAELEAIKSHRESLELADSESKLAAFFKAMTQRKPDVVQEQNVATATVTETEEERRVRLWNRYRKLLTTYIRERHGVRHWENQAEFGRLIKRYQIIDNDEQSVKSAKNASPDQIQERIDKYERLVKSDD